MTDLIVLSVDGTIKSAVIGILSRPEALNIRLITSDFRVHPEHDPGCLLRGHLFLKPFVNQYSHALILFDREGSGREHFSREDLETEVEGQLATCGWADRAAVIVIDPELETWAWSDSPHVDSVLGWKGKSPTLRDTLRNEGYFPEGYTKPVRPKEAFLFALRTAKKPRSSSLYRQIADKVSLERCIDPSFVKLKEILHKWFPIE